MAGVSLTGKQAAHLLRMAKVYVREAKYGDPRDYDPETVKFAEGYIDSIERALK